MKSSDEVPRVLYKYQPQNSQAVDNLRNQEIWFGAPKDFNDPFDCALKPQIPIVSDGQAMGLAKKFLDLPSRQGDVVLQRQFSEISPQEWFERMNRDLLREISKQADTISSNSGISCFSEVNDNLLMWSHYAEQHRGFCLEFTTNSSLFQKVKKVQYSSVVPVLEPERIFAQKDFEQVARLFCTKSEDWAYEQEWRVFDRKIAAKQYPSDALTAIYLGARAEEPLVNEICEIVRRNLPRTKLYRGRLSETHFRIEFDPIVDSE